MQKNNKPRMFSAIQPTGKLHIGNYIGALSVWAKEQELYDGLFSAVDLHALTIPENITPQALHAKTLETIAIYLAAGLDPKKCSIFIQSTVPEHTELSWLLTCATPMGWLERMTQFKAKSSSRETVGTGLFCYPALMAADILLYDTKIVPVGEDQLQHIELTRDVAQRFNNMFGSVFVLPEPMIRAVGARIMGLDDPSKKMSKSEGDSKAGHSIGVLDEPDVITKAIKSAVTDMGREVSCDSAEGGIKNLLVIYQTITGETEQQVKDKFEGKGYGFLKSETAESVCEKLRPIREETQRILADKVFIQRIVDQGAEKARTLAKAKIGQVKQAMGISFARKAVQENKVKLGNKPHM